MTYMSQNPGAIPLGAITIHRIVSAVFALGQRIGERYTAHRTTRILQSLSARQLDDIGLMPDDIARYATRGRRI
jgi:uncharacterized protein YjiS (DUF1127 family)